LPRNRWLACVGITGWNASDYAISAVRPQTAAWYAKREPTFSDAIAAVRRALWCPPGLPMSRQSTETIKVPVTLLQRLTDTLCHAA